MREIPLNGDTLTRHEVWDIAKGRASAVIPEDILKRVYESRTRIEAEVHAGNVVYGVTTGFGKLSDVRINREDVQKLQVNLLRSHAVGVGEPFSQDVVRAMLVLRANALAKGYSGIRTETLQLLVDLLAHGVHPVVPSQGSLGASGDLAPLAHMALVLIGEGEAVVDGQLLAGHQALERVGLSPVRLDAKEGLALINGTQAMTAVGALTLCEAESLGLAADAAACLSMEAHRGIICAYDDALVRTRPHMGQIIVAQRLRNWLQGSGRVTKQGQLRVQDAYSLRCVPQVHGASWQALWYVDGILQTELNSATDNPIVLTDGQVLSGGQFHGQPVALALDFLKLAASEWANISERRIERLVNPSLSGLPPFLAAKPGLESGLMISQYVAASLVSENKVLAHPASVDSIPSSANQEDHVSMGTIAGRQAQAIVHNAARVIAIEQICASQALWLMKAEKSLAPTSKLYVEFVRDWCPPVEEDRSLAAEIEALASAIRGGEGPWQDDAAT